MAIYITFFSYWSIYNCSHIPYILKNKIEHLMILSNLDSSFLTFFLQVSPFSCHPFISMVEDLLLLILIFFPSSAQLGFCLFWFYFCTFWPLRHSSPCRSIPFSTPFSCCIYFIVFWERCFFLKGDL